MKRNPYLEKGYSSRAEYLLALAEEYGMEQHDVALLAGTLGPQEDFDGLISTLEDFTAFAGEGM